MGRGNWTGSVITFATSGFVAQLLDSIDWGGVERAVIDTTHFGATQPSGARQIGGRTSIPGKLADPGELTLQIAYDPTLDIPIGSTDTAETISIQPPSDISSNPISGSGYVRSFRKTAPLEGYATAVIVIKWTGIVSTPAT